MTNNSTFPSFTISYGRRLVFFLCVSVLCFLITNLIVGLLISLKGATPALIRISAVLQDVLVFILPAVATSLLITRLPARFLAVDRAPSFKIVLLSLTTLVVSIPAMNCLIAWNESITMPDALSGMEQWMRNAESQAGATIKILLGDGSMGTFILSILIVGILAGFSEEIFFRGALQRLLASGGIGGQSAIWIAAFIFSATHLQFYGFFPRLLLGAYFGYLLYWTGCLWIPIIVHIANNALYIVSLKVSSSSASSVDLNSFGSHDYIIAALSVCMTAFMLGIIYKFTVKKLSNGCIGH